MIVLHVIILLMSTYNMVSITLPKAALNDFRLEIN